MFLATIVHICIAWRWKNVNEALSERELSIVRLVAEGKTINEVGKDLSISPHTVRKHLLRIRLKLRARNGAQTAYNPAEKRILQRSRNAR